jgi:hypothetical protein
MTPPTQNIEVLFLKIFKGAVLVIMGLTLISILVLCMSAVYQFSQTPKQPVPAQKAPEKDPEKEINIDNLKQFLIDREKQENNKNETSKQQNGPQTSLLFLEDATALYRCSVDFANRIGVITESADDTQNLQRVNEFRWKLERIASSPLLGETWVKAAKPFICTALADESIIALKKQGAVKTIFFPILEFHAETWKKIQNEKVQFEQSEKDRVSRQWNDELNRVSSAKAGAIANLIAAGCSFAVFMSLALYLIIAKIETNLRDINDSIRNSSRNQTNNTCNVG